MGSGSVKSAVAVSDSARLGTVLLLGAIVEPIALTVLGGEKTLLLGTNGLGKSLEVRADGAVEVDVVERSDNQHDDHEDQRSKGATRVDVDQIGSVRRVGRLAIRTLHSGAAGRHGEKADEADLSNVQTDKEVLQGARVDTSLGVNVDVVNKEQVVAVGKVEQVQADGREEEDERGNRSVADSNDL